MNKDLELQKILDNYRYVGVTVLHTNKDCIDYFQNFGYCDLEHSLSISSNNIFRIASISKVVVALCALKLYEMKKLDLDEDISKYLGYVVRNPYFETIPITTKMLMTQTSSIFDGGEDEITGYDAVNGPSMYVPLEDMLTNEDYAYYSPKTFLPYKPGSYFCYSNFGCGILACIVEKVSGMLFTDFVKTYILKPLNIDGGFRAEDVEKKYLIASLYDFENDDFKLVRNTDKFLSVMFPKYPIGDNFRGPAGGLFISPFDLAKIMIMLMNDGLYENVRVFEESTIKYMKQTHWQGESNEPEYKKKGLQLLQLDGYSKQTLMGHFGYAYGLRSFMLFNETNGYIFMSNGADYKNFAEHMTQMQEDILKYLIKKFEN